MDNEIRFKKLVEAFQTLAVRDTDCKYLSTFQITEQSLINNFQKLFGHKCDIFAKILYMKMVRNKDHAKINFLQFVDVFMDLLDEYKDVRNRVLFNLLDLKGTGKLDIMIFIQIANQVDRNTLLG